MLLILFASLSCSSRAEVLQQCHFGNPTLRRKEEFAWKRGKLSGDGWGATVHCYHLENEHCNARGTIDRDNIYYI